MSTALLHLRPPAHIDSSIREMARVSKPGGFLIVDLSTEVKRSYTEGKRAGEEARGLSEVSYTMQKGGKVLQRAIDGLFDIQRVNYSDIQLDLVTQDGKVHLETKKINVLARRK